VEAGWIEAWAERARRLGILILILAVCGGLGVLISLPLWLFATAEPRLYTILVLTLIGAGAVYLSVRAIQRRLTSEPGARPGWAVLAGLLSALMTVFVLASLYSLAVLLSRGLWLMAGAVLAVSFLFLWLLSLARRAARRRRKEAPVPAENNGR
jgi:hypothetical protein